MSLTPKFVNDIHKRGGTIIGTSRGGHDTSKIVDSIQDRGINQVCRQYYFLSWLSESHLRSFVLLLHLGTPLQCMNI